MRLGSGLLSGFCIVGVFCLLLTEFLFGRHTHTHTQSVIIPLAARFQCLVVPNVQNAKLIKAT